MSTLYLALPLSLLVALIAVIVFVLQAKNGQFEDLETPPRRMLFDEVAVNKKKNAGEEQP